MANYLELLKDPRWQKKRLEIFLRDNWTCQYCQSTDKTLNVHHMMYVQFPWDVENDWLITFCEQCHKIEEELCGDNKTMRLIAEITGVPALFQMELLNRCIGDNGIVSASEVIHSYDHLYSEGERIYYPKEGSAKIAQPDHEQSEVEKQ